MKEYILVINPGSTSTKIAIFNQEGKEIFSRSITHSIEELSQFKSLLEQGPVRKKIILDTLKKENIEFNSIKTIIGRGGVLKPLEAGTYEVNNKLINDLKNSPIEHASNLGGIIAHEIAEKIDVPAYIADPVSVDEFADIARISGLKGIERKSLLHTLNIRANAFRYAREQGKKFEEINLIVAHLGGGISIAPIMKGKIVDVNNANDGGPFSPERSGSLPNKALIHLCYSGKYSEKELYKLITNQGGLVSYLGTNDTREVMKKIEQGDNYAKLIFEAMCYQIAKEIGAMAAVLKGKVEAIILTGGIAHNEILVNKIKERAGWIAPVVVYPGEEEMKALAQAVIRVINGVEKVKTYS
ncbi:butyrate kinase [Candidatus Oleimmundimicrobium sp.]|uniref:butyrate kinase n=1 Tax=Candidatus Oleimmundimicrobium sp. TaxID=3060597 RepID=UPI00272380CA|nr:butyrate kinase [Candidatus Oleimmundimicrobium sp.]MDO8886208.1 butyrate kinase [Candidatus Oleimmundimicrobium sp.]